MKSTIECNLMICGIIIAFFVSGFCDQAGELCDKCYSCQWNTEPYAACWCTRGIAFGLV